MMENKTSHHVVWADRIGLNKQWERDIQVCSDAFRTERYPEAVMRFKHNIPNIKDGPQLRSYLEKYEKEDLAEFKESMLQEWMKANPYEVNSMEAMDEEKERIVMDSYEMMYDFILQTLEDNNFEFYKSEYDGEYDEMK